MPPSISAQYADAVEMFTTDQIQGNNGAFNHNKSGLQALMTNVPNAMTSTLRTSSGELAPGVALISEPHIHIEWAWITFPLMLYVLTVCFLMTVALQGRTGVAPTRVWKNSIVAAICHGLKGEPSGKLAGLYTQKQIDDTVNDIEVKLEMNALGTQLACAEPRELIQWQPEANGVGR